MKAVVVLSGGVDSTVALYQANQQHDVEAVSFHYGSKHNHKEIPFAEYHCGKLCIKHTVFDLEQVIGTHFRSDLLTSGGAIPEGHYEAEDMKRTVVPFRNGIMLAVACGYAESVDAKKVIIGAHGGDHAIYPDCRDDFNEAFGQAMKRGTWNGVELIVPFQKLRKEDIAKLGTELGIDFSKTWSCYKGADLHCGVCGTCNERMGAFKLAGVDDPTVYSI